MSKRYAPGITEKRLRNRRFRKTEEAILRVFFEEDVYIGVEEMAKRVGVARTTIYNHHKAVREIVMDYKKYILRKYDRALKKQMTKKKLKTNEIYMQMLLFIIRNKTIFRIILRDGGQKIFAEMVMKNRAALMRRMGLPINYEKVFLIYVGEVVALLEKWAKEGFEEAGIEIVVKDLIYLTETARSRLTMLEQN